MILEKVFGEIGEQVKINERLAVRAVIYKDDQILMVKTNKGDYKFPGGGKEQDESDEETVIREVLEETGYRVAAVVQKLGDVVQQKKDLYEADTYFRMVSSYYECILGDDERIRQQLDDYEEEQEFAAEFITMEEAIKQNEELLKSGREDINPWVERDTYVLKELNDRKGK